MNLNLIHVDGDEYVFEIVKDKKVIGGLELNFSSRTDHIFIENIVKDRDYKGKRLVEEVVNYLREKYNKNIGCLPLNQYRKYYESIGFKEYFRANNDEDIYYILRI